MRVKLAHRSGEDETTQRVRRCWNASLMHLSPGNRIASVMPQNLIGERQSVRWMAERTENHRALTMDGGRTSVQGATSIGEKPGTQHASRSPGEMERFRLSIIKRLRRLRDWGKNGAEFSRNVC